MTAHKGVLCHNAGVGWIQSKTIPESTLDRFRAFLKTLLSVSKKDIDEAIATERAAKERDVEPSED